MAVIDDLVNSGLTDEAIIDLLMEKRRRERIKMEIKHKVAFKPKITETKVKTLASEDANSDFRQAINDDIITENLNNGAHNNNNNNTNNDTSMEALKTAISEMADNVLYRIGQLCVGTKLDTKSAIQIICQHLDAKQSQSLEIFTNKIDALIAGQERLESEICNLQLKSDQSISDGTSIRNNLSLIQAKQNDLEQDIARAQIMGYSVTSDETQQFYPNIPTNVYPRPDAETRLHPQTYTNNYNFNPQHQPNLGTSGGFSEFLS